MKLAHRALLLLFVATCATWRSQPVSLVDAACSATLTPSGTSYNGTEHTTGWIHSDTDGYNSTNYAAYEACTWYVNCTDGSYFGIQEMQLNTESGFDPIEVWSAPSGGTRIGVFSGSSTNRILSTTSSNVRIRFTSDWSGHSDGFSFRWVCATSPITAAPSTPAPPVTPAPAHCSSSLTAGGTSYTGGANTTGWIHSDTDGYNSTHYTTSEACTWYVNCTGGSYFSINQLQYQTESYDHIRVYDQNSGSTLATFYGTSSSTTYATSATAVRVTFTSDGSIQYDGFSLQWLCSPTAPPTTAPVSTASPSSSCSSSLTPTASSYNGTVGSSGWIYSDTDGYGANNYRNSESCTWYVNCTDGSYVGISSIQYQTENYDRIRLYDQSSGSYIRAYTGIGSSSTTYTTSSTALRITFSSDPWISLNGFSLQWTCATAPSTASPSSTCSSSLTPTASSYNGTVGSSGWIYSDTDGYGANNYRNSEICTWYVNCTDGSYFTINQLQYQTETYDRLRIWDSTTEFFQVGLGSYSGSASSGTLNTSTSQVRITFTSDSSFTYNGFSMQWMCSPTPGTPAPTARTPAPTVRTCSATNTVSNSSYTGSTGSTGWIFSDWDGYGSTRYLNSEDCTWYVTCTGGSYVSINELQIDTETGYDPVRIYDQSSGSRLGNFYGSSTSEILNTTSSAVRIHFTTDRSLTKRGFSLQWLCSPTAATPAPTTSYSTSAPSTTSYTNGTWTCPSVWTYERRMFLEQLNCTRGNRTAACKTTLDACLANAATQCTDVARCYSDWYLCKNLAVFHNETACPHDNTIHWSHVTHVLTTSSYSFESSSLYRGCMALMCNAPRTIAQSRGGQWGCAHGYRHTPTASSYREWCHSIPQILAHSASYRSSVLAAKPVAYWPMEKADASHRITDLVGNATLNGTAHGTFSFFYGVHLSASVLPNSTQSGRSLFLNDRIVTAASSLIYSSNYTAMYCSSPLATSKTHNNALSLEMWLKQTSDISGTERNIISDRQNNSWSFALTVRNVNTYRFYAGHEFVEFTRSFHTAGYLAVTWNLASGEVVVYINASVVVRKKVATAQDTPAGKNPICIGRDDFRRAPGLTTLDEVALYDRVLTAEHMAQVYSAAPGSPGATVSSNSGSGGSDVVTDDIAPGTSASSSTGSTNSTASSGAALGSHTLTAVLVTAALVLFGF